MGWSTQIARLVPICQLVERHRPFVPVPVVVTLTDALIDVDGATVTLVEPLRRAEFIVRSAKTERGKPMKTTAITKKAVTYFSQDLILIFFDIQFKENQFME